MKIQNTIVKYNSTWSGSDKETFYLRLKSSDYVKSDSSQQINGTKH